MIGAQEEVVNYRHGCENVSFIQKWNKKQWTKQQKRNVEKKNRFLLEKEKIEAQMTTHINYRFFVSNIYYNDRLSNTRNRNDE